MTYSLGIDLGTTFTAAAVSRSGSTQIAALDDRSAEMPSVVLLRQNGAVLTGSAAERRASIEPERVAREFKRRLGDPTPLIVDGTPQPVTSLLAHLLRSVVAKVTAAEGEPPSVVTLTHPANWGPYKRDLFDQVPQLAEIHEVRMVTEPEAAAAHYASTERVADGAMVAVYDLGGGTFDATVLRKTGGSFEILGKPQGIEGLGGIDFDEAVFAHVRESLGGDVTVDRASLVRLRQECVLAKEALSADTEATIPVLLPGTHTHIRLTRGEFEDMIRPALADTLTTLRGALRSASVAESELTAVLLVGGSSRIPLVAKMVSAELKCPIAVDTHPKHAVALGAAALNASVSVTPTPMPPTPVAILGVDIGAENAGGTYPGAGSSAYRPPIQAGFVAAANTRGSGGADHPDRNTGEDTAHPRFGSSDAPPSLASTPRPRTAMPSKRYALLLGVIIATFLLGIGGLRAGVFATPAPVVHTPLPSPVRVQPLVDTPPLIQSAQPPSPAPLLAPPVRRAPIVTPPPQVVTPPPQVVTPPPHHDSGSGHHDGGPDCQPSSSAPGGKNCSGSSRGCSGHGGSNDGCSGSGNPSGANTSSANPSSANPSSGSGSSSSGDISRGDSNSGSGSNQSGPNKSQGSS